MGSQPPRHQNCIGSATQSTQPSAENSSSTLLGSNESRGPTYDSEGNPIASRRSQTRGSRRGGEQRGQPQPDLGYPPNISPDPVRDLLPQYRGLYPPKDGVNETRSVVGQSSRRTSQATSGGSEEQLRKKTGFTSQERTENNDRTRKMTRRMADMSVEERSRRSSGTTVKSEYGESVMTFDAGRESEEERRGKSLGPSGRQADGDGKPSISSKKISLITKAMSRFQCQASNRGSLRRRQRGLYHRRAGTPKSPCIPPLRRGCWRDQSC